MTLLGRQTALTLAAAWVLAAGSTTARAQDVHLASAVAAPTNMHVRGVATLRDRTAFDASAAPGVLAGTRASDDPAVPPPSALSDTVRGAIGCTIGGTIATAAAFAAGGENTVNIVAGGLVPSVNRAALYVGLAGVVFGSFCAIGQALTPIVTRHFAEPPPPPSAVPPPRFDTRHASAQPTIPQRVAHQSGVLGAAVASGARRIGATALANVPIPLRAAPPVLAARQP